jgi:ABC-2 type transport system ATP-binding protein
MAAIAIQTQNLTRTFGARRAVDDLTLQVMAGAVFGLLGPRGSGKTTLLHMLLGLLPPTAGSAQIWGFDVQTQGEVIHAHTGALLDQTPVCDDLSAAENLTLYGQIQLLAEEERRVRSRALLTHLGLWERQQEKVGTWDLEMKRRIALACVLLHRPPLIFVDELTHGLTEEAAMRLQHDFIKLIRQESITVFLTTESLAEAEALCDCIGVYHRGRVLAMAEPAALRRFTALQVQICGRGFTPNLVSLLRRRADVATVCADDRFLYIDLSSGVGSSAGEAVNIAPLVTLLVESGAEVEEVHKRAISLADLYSKLLHQA